MKIYASLLCLAVLGVSCSDSEFAGKAPSQKQYSSSGDSDGTADSSKGIDTSTVNDGTGDPDSVALSGSCDEKHGKKEYHLRSSDNTDSVSALEHSNLKVTGSDNVLTVTVAAGQSIGAICLDISGGRNKVQFVIDGKVGEIKIKARGNDPVIDVLSNKSAELSKISFDDDKHIPTLLVHGEGKFPCDENLGIVCKK